MNTIKPLFFSVVLAAAIISTPLQTALAATAPSLGTAQSFAILGGSTVTNTGSTIIATGNLGVRPGLAITGFPPGILIGGTIHAADGVALQAQNDNATAYTNLAGQACNFDLTGQDLGGMTLVPGVYCFSSSAQLTGALTLNAQGNPAAVWVFQIGSTLTTAVNSSVKVINGGQQCNVFWQVGSSATLGTDTSFVGNILALTSVTLNTNTNLSGRALAQNGAVTMDSNAVAISVCAPPPGTPVPPTLGKAFSPATINADGTSILTLTLSNPDTKAAVLSASLTDTLPSGMLVAGNASNTCGGTVTASLGSATVSLSGGSIPPNNGSCTVTVPVTAANGGSYINSIAAGALKTGNGNNTNSAISTLTVNSSLVSTPIIGKAFSPATITEGDTSILTLTLSNPDAKVADLTTPLTDVLPSGMVVVLSPNGFLLPGAPSTTCGGKVTIPTDGTKVILTGGSIPANRSCTVTVTVKVAKGGNYINSLATGALQTSNGSNAAPAIATLTVNPTAGVTPLLGKSFSPATIYAGGSSTLIITLSNSGAKASSLTAPLVDTLPDGMVIVGSASTSCGGTVSAVPGGSKITLTGGSIPAHSECTVSVVVEAANTGNYFNSLAIGALQTDNGDNITQAISTLTVSSPSTPNAPTGVTLSKTFSPATIEVGGRSTLSITLSNVGSKAASLIAPLTDNLPSGVLVDGYASTTCGGKVTYDDYSVTLKGGSIPAKKSCTVTVRVIGLTEGCNYNVLAAGDLQTNKGSNNASTVATLTILPAISSVPTLNKAFNPTIISAGGQSMLTITLKNPSSAPAKLTAPLTDIFPNAMLISGKAFTSCGGTVTAALGGSKMVLKGGTIPAKSACIVKVNVTAKTNGSYTNKLPIGALNTNKGNNKTAAAATLTVTSATTKPSLNKTFSPISINAGGLSTLVTALSIYDS